MTAFFPPNIAYMTASLENVHYDQKNFDQHAHLRKLCKILAVF